MTKYELAAQLRDLNRGMPRLPISTMKKHEIEANIDALRKYKGLVAEEMSTKPANAKPGPLGPRQIEVSEEVEGDDGLTIRMPKAPAPRVSVKPAKVKVVVPKVEIDSEAPVVKPKKVVIKEPKATATASTASTASTATAAQESRKSAPVMTHFCNCPECPIKKRKTG